MFGATVLKNKVHLSPYAQRLVEGLLPLLERIDSEKIDAKSAFEITRGRDGWVLHIFINSIDPDIPFLDLFASKGQCILGFAESEQIESHSAPDKDKDLVAQVLEAIAAYLNGITILEHYNKNNRVVKKEYFFGMDSESQRERQIGTSYHPFVFPKKVASVEKKVFKFFK